MAKKKKAQYGQKTYPGTQLDSWQKYMKSQESTGIPDPQAELNRIQNMHIPALPPQDYGVQASDPEAGLRAGLGVYNKKKRTPTDWGMVGTSALLLANALIPGEPIHNPVVRPQASYNPYMYGTGSQAIAASGIHIDPSKKGTFTAAAKKHGKSVQAFASQVLANKENYSPAMVKKANFARNAKKWKKGEDGIQLSDTGYQYDSPDKNKKKLRIPSNHITMDKVPFPVFGVSDTGDSQYMVPGEEYYYDGSYVDETPLSAANGLSSAKAKEMLRDGTAHGKKLTAKQKRYFGWIAGGGHAQNGMNLNVNPLGNIVGTPQQREAANLEAQRLAAKYKLMDPSNMQIGQYLPQYVDEAGNPYRGAPTRQLPTTVPDSINLEDIKSEQGMYWYEDPHTGDPVDIDPTALRAPRFQKPKQQVAMDLMKRAPVAGSTSSLWFGGRLKYKNGGSITPITPSTVKINGPSHDNGGVPFMGIEAEGGETAFKSDDGSVYIMGNMINPLTGRKFKEDSKRIAKKEQQMSELMDYSIELVNDADIKDKYDILKFNSGRVQFQGAAKKKQELKQSQEHLSNIQQAMLDYAEEWGIDPGAFSRNQIRPAKYEFGGRIKAQNGKKLSLAERHNNPGNLKWAKWMEKYGAVKGEPGTDGGNFAKFPTMESGQSAMIALLKDKKYSGKSVEDAIKTWTNNQSYKNIPQDLRNKKVSELDPTQFVNLLDTITKGEDSKLYNWEGITDAPKPIQDERLVQETLNIPGTNYNPNRPGFPGAPDAGRVGRRDYNFDIQNPKNYYAPSDARGLSFTQILPELYAAATNKVEPVYMQEYTPQLYQDYELSLQDQLNQNQASFSALSKAPSLRNNPEALSVLAGQKYQADSQVLANEFRINQANTQDVVNKNIALLNDAEQKNLGLADIQFTRQSTAKSKTKLQNQLVLNSIADKVTQNNYEQRLQKVYENLYPNYRFGEDYQTDYYGPNAGEAVNWDSNGLSPIQDEAAVTLKTNPKGETTVTKKYASPIQKQLQDLQLITNKAKYNDYFINRERSFAKRYNNLTF